MQLHSGVPTILKLMYAKHYAVFEQGLLNLNIIGVRSSSRRAGGFDDELHVVYKELPNVWVDAVFTITTDPGLTYLHDPMRRSGCAILLPGQYRRSHRIGVHKGRYAALVQDKPMRIVRDVNRDAILDVETRLDEAIEGVFGINIHAADTNPFDNLDPSRVEVGAWSAGCQVFKDSKEYREFWSLVQRSSRVYGKSFTYTLLD